MKEVTCWKVYKTVSNTGLERTVLVGLNPVGLVPFVEDVQTTSDREINGYKLVGVNNTHYPQYNETWFSWVTQNNVNSITDISEQYE